MVDSSIISNFDRKFIILGGKGGVGKTSSAASFAVAFADAGQKTLIISTDPAHSLSDSFNQDLSGGAVIKIEGIDNLYAMEINPEEASGDLKSISGLEDDTETVDDIMGTLSSLGFDEMGDLFDTMPPGVDEALALAKVVQFTEDEEYQEFQRIIFDTAPTGHTLRLLALPTFLDSFIGKIYRMRVRMNNAAAAFKSLLGMQSEKDKSLEIMEKLKESMEKVQSLFRNHETTEFMIVTIPTIMAANESGRLAEELKINGILVREILINQIMPMNVDCRFCSVRAKGQEENLGYLRNLFANMNITEVEFFDREIRGLDGLRLMGNSLLI